MHATNNKEKDQSQEKCDIFRHYKGKLKNTIADNKRFTKLLIAKLPNWRYFFEILAKLGLRGLCVFSQQAHRSKSSTQRLFLREALRDS